MEKPPIDPLLLEQYNKRPTEVFSDAAKRALMPTPDKALMEMPESQLVDNPDRIAEQKSAEAFKNPKTQTWLNNGDQVAAMREAKDEEKLQKAIKEIGQNPDTYAGPLFRGIINEQLFPSPELSEIKDGEKKVIESTDSAREGFVDNIPKGTQLPSRTELEILMKRDGGLFAEGPYDQDKVA